MLRTLLAALAAFVSGASACSQVTPRHDVLTAAFEGGFVGEAAGERFPVRPLRLGELNLASGRLVLADPFIVSGKEKPLDLAIRPGRYPVDLAVADTGKGGQRVALARLVLSDKKPVRWAMAVTADQDVRKLKGDEVFGYGVDAGTGSFMDAGSLAWLADLKPEAFEARANDWQARGEAQAPKLGIPYGFALVEPVGPGGVVMFSSGWGDGFYASWVGYDAAGRPAVVVTNFAVISAVSGPR
jgi:hypothetical protein